MSFVLLQIIFKPTCGGILTWPIQYDRMNLTEIWQQQTLFIEHDQKIINITTTINLKVWIWPKLKLTNLKYIFRSCSIVNVRRCKKFWSNSNQNSVIFIRSCELASTWAVFDLSCCSSPEWLSVSLCHFEVSLSHHNWLCGFFTEHWENIILLF